LVAALEKVIKLICFSLFSHSLTQRLFWLFSVLADANFPASSICACGPKEIRADGLGIPQLLEAILKLLPLDTYVSSPAAVMDLVDSDKQRALAVPVWDTYTLLLGQAGSQAPLEKVERFAFYERAKKAYAVVATGCVSSLP
uniref:L-fucose mutarotase n=1 Tax=Lates calcarifer TaxID=8187 RepID=A0A4W6DRA3_LATCA